MFSHATLLLLLLLAALPTFAGVAGGEVVSVVSAGPRFAREQTTQVVAPLGHAAVLDCSVLNLLDKSVSWVWTRDLQILSHAGVVFTADARVSTTVVPGAGAAATRHSLRIERLRTGDSGRYECQVNTEPKMSLLFNLTVVDEAVPSVVLVAQDGWGAAGGAGALQCAARYSPAPRALAASLAPLDVRWYRRGALLDLQSSRGGVSLDTERWAARVTSRLTLAELAPHDAGEYVCAAGQREARAYLRVLPADDDADELSAEAMQRDEAARAHTCERARAHTCALVAACALLWAR